MIILAMSIGKTSHSYGTGGVIEYLGFFSGASDNLLSNSIGTKKKYCGQLSQTEEMFGALTRFLCDTS